MYVYVVDIQKYKDALINPFALCLKNARGGAIGSASSEDGTVQRMMMVSVVLMFLMMMIMTMMLTAMLANQAQMFLSLAWVAEFHCSDALRTSCSSACQHGQLLCCNHIYVCVCVCLCLCLYGLRRMSAISLGQVSQVAARFAGEQHPIWGESRTSVCQCSD